VVELQEEGSESTDGAGEGSSDGEGSTTGDSSGSDDESDGDTGAESPGFGVVAAALALLATGLLARRN
jgi:iron complex transport system substrate-binding protein